MKKITKTLFLFLLTFLCILPVNAKEKVNLYLFWGDGCPHCAMEKEYLETLEKEFPNLTITKYEVWYNEENKSFLNKIATETNNSFTGVPVTIIGQTIIKGFGTTTEQEIRRAVSYYTENKHHDIVSEIKNGTYEGVEEIPDTKFQKEEKKLDEKTTTKLPIIGEINYKNYDLLTAIPILGVLTALSFLSIFLTIIYSLLLNQKEKKEKILLSLAYIIIISITHIINTNLNISLLNGLGRLIILLLTIFFIINFVRKTKPSNKLENILLIIFSLAVGLVIPTTNLNILNTLISLEEINALYQIIINISYVISFIIPIILLLFIIYKVEKIVSKKIKLVLNTILLIINIFVINFI